MIENIPLIILDSDGDPICCGIFLFIISISMILNGVNKYLIMRKIENTPTSKIRSVALGLTEIYGKPKSIERTYSPVSKDKCVYYMLDVDYYQSGKHGGWRDLFKVKFDDNFYLEDETGKIFVNPKNCNLEIEPDKTYIGFLYKGFLKNEIDEKALNYINNLSPELSKKLYPHKHQQIRIFEYLIKEEDSLYVLGSVEPLDKLSTELVIKKGAEKTLYICDKEEKIVLSNIKNSVYINLFGGLLLGMLGLIIIFLRLNML